MKFLILLILSFNFFNLSGQREHVSSEKIRFAIKDSEYLGSRDGAIIPNITTGFRPFDFIWLGPNGFVSTDSILTDAPPGVYILKWEDAQCGFFEDTIVIKTVYNISGDDALFELLTMAPNPFTDYLDVELSIGKEQLVSLTIFNHIGEQAFSITQKLPKGNQKVRLNTQDIPPGIYLIQCCIALHCTTVKKIIKV